VMWLFDAVDLLKVAFAYVDIHDDGCDLAI